MNRECDEISHHDGERGEIEQNNLKGLKRKYDNSISNYESDGDDGRRATRTKHNSTVNNSAVLLEEIKHLKSNLIIKDERERAICKVVKFWNNLKTTKNNQIKGYKTIFKVTPFIDKKKDNEKSTEQFVDGHQAESVDKVIDEPPEQYFDIFRRTEKIIGTDFGDETSILSSLEMYQQDAMELEPTLIRDESLNLSYYNLFKKELANRIFRFLETKITYFTGHMSQVVIFGQLRNIPRKQVAYGDEGLTYSFSGNTFPAKPWTPLVRELCNIVSKIANEQFNFVLINRYKDGKDHIGEHRDNEPDLDPLAPIASLSLGQQRQFLFRHRDLRFKKPTTIEPRSLELEHGSLLVMHHPTNIFWYHSLPRSKATRPRINMTFRKILPKNEPKE